MNDLPVIYRPLRETDCAYIANTWALGVKHNCIALRNPELFWLEDDYTIARYKHLAGRLMRGMPELFTVVCDEENEDTIVAWYCSQGSMLHWIHVKKDFQGYGLCREATKNVKVITHQTYKSREFGIRFEPRLFRELFNRLYQERVNGTNQTSEPMDAGVHEHQRGGGADIHAG